MVPLDQLMKIKNGNHFDNIRSFLFELRHEIYLSKKTYLKGVQTESEN